MIEGLKSVKFDLILIYDVHLVISYRIILRHFGPFYFISKSKACKSFRVGPCA